MAVHGRQQAESLADLLDIQAGTRPDAEALTDGEDRLTWIEYRDRARRLGAALAERGVGAGDRVGVHLPKSVDAFVAVHAVLGIGAIVVPVDWFAPPTYAAEVLRDAGAAAVISRATGERLDSLRRTSEVRHAVAPTVSADSASTEPAPIGPADPAYIVYTSGSTGRPKGIVHTHASALAYAHRAAATYGLRADDRLANIAPLHFDQSTFELYAAPIAGAAVLTVPDGVLRFPASVSELVERERITVWYSVPFAITQLSERGALDERDLSSLRWVLFGGENFAPALLRSAMHRLPTARFSNVYGPAEVNQCTYHHLDAPPEGDAPVPIGRPWEATAVRITDGGRPVDDGDVGELLVSTDTMMQGYWNRPDLTVAAITEEPGDDAGRRWYHTGDLVRRREDGELVFEGRVDHQVKVRGFRVELEAIELVIGEEPGVDACAVVVDGDGLVALVSPAPDDTARRSLVRRLRARLPAYAVPSRIVGIAAVPRTGTGKVDRPAAAAMLVQRDLSDRPASDPVQ